MLAEGMSSTDLVKCLEIAKRTFIRTWRYRDKPLTVSDLRFAHVVQANYNGPSASQAVGNQR